MATPTTINKQAKPAAMSPAIQSATFNSASTQTLDVAVLGPGA
jgi:hypothetical protein